MFCSALSGPALFCAECGDALPAADAECPRCRRDAPERAESPGLIGTMWALSGLAWVCGYCFEVPLGLLLDMVAVILALVLVCGRSRRNKKHGKAKLGLELAFFLILALAAAVAVLREPATPP